LRCYHTHPAPYSGYWSLILDQIRPMTSVETNKTPLKLETPAPASTPPHDDHPSFVLLQGKQMSVPKKPPPPENCCMSGCTYW
ncbi:hypothetical protein DM01DRAFT_1267467, partial [Hesseltinella vesiculosa]